MTKETNFVSYVFAAIICLAAGLYWKSMSLYISGAFFAIAASNGVPTEQDK